MPWRLPAAPRDDVVHRAVVAEVDHLGALRQDAPHDVDRRVVAVEQARGGDEAQRRNSDIKRLDRPF
jgi:3-deoxy-D-manno-octulosonate 8-phosphate phosphatase KdsC-like HAD superfamily phosphatase